MAVRRVQVRIRGRVQGVWYRGWTVIRARELNLAGWVRNRRDGSVEALFEGDGADVAIMLDDCRQGPPAARVTTVETMPSDEIPGSTFRQVATD